VIANPSRIFPELDHSSPFVLMYSRAEVAVAQSNTVCGKGAGSRRSIVVRSFREMPARPSFSLWFFQQNRSTSSAAWTDRGRRRQKEEEASSGREDFGWPQHLKCLKPPHTCLSFSQLSSSTTGNAVWLFAVKGAWHREGIFSHS